jgi:hypothetical protein
MIWDLGSIINIISVLLDNRDLNLPATGRCSDAYLPGSVQAGVEIKHEFPFNASCACLCRQTGLTRGSLL